jgi:argininosuccinate lyase
LMALLTVMKGLPLTYNKDMQEDKEALFDTADTLEACLHIMSRLIGEISFHGEQMNSAARKGYLVATDLADYFVTKGMPFRQAHEVVGRMVLFALEQNKELHELSLEEMKRFTMKIEEDVLDWLDPLSSVNRRNLPGGTGPERVKEAIARARKELEG